LLTAPVLLLARFIWPSKVSWWAVAASVALISWGSLVLGEIFELRAESECTVQIVGNALVGCSIYERWYSYNRELGGLKGLIYLLPWLALYAGLTFILDRRRRNGGALPNTSFERTREG
jgi:hypothetical protein